MPSDLKMTVVSGADLAQLFERAPEKARGILRTTMNAGMILLQSAMARNVRQTFRQRSGALADIAIEPIAESGGELTGRVGSTLEYAEIQEKGGEIRAKNVRNLTIPLEPFMTGRGVARGSAHDVIANPSSFGYDGTFFSKGVLYGRHGNATTEPLFALKPSVTLQARPYAQPAIDEIKPEYAASVTSALEALL
jgi:hypothetical protein